MSCCLECVTVIHGTMRPQDLIPAFTAELRSRIQKANSRRRNPPWLDIPEHLHFIEESMKLPGYYEFDCTTHDLHFLFEKLAEVAPDKHYFGSHPGDGSDYGFWCVE